MHPIKQILTVIFKEDVLKPNFCTSTEVLGTSRDVATGEACGVDSDSGLPDSRCYFFPNINNQVTSSYMALPFLDSVTDFCDDISEANIHHDDIPTKHNLYCEGKSTWAVIEASEDFADGANPAKPDIETTPKFKIVQSRTPRYVVLMDISLSMVTGPDPTNQPELTNSRSDNLRNAVKRWVTYEVADGTEVALVVFSNVAPSFDPVIFKMEKVSDSSRPRMVEAVDSIEFDGQTCIGCGIDRALSWEGALNKTSGGVIILITDGEQMCETGPDDPRCLTIGDMTPQVLASQTRVVTIAFGLTADPALETLASKSGGKSFFIDDYSGPGAIHDAFTGSLTYQPGDVLGNSTIEVYQHDHSGVKEDKALTGFFDIDVSIGRDVSFQIEVKTNADCTEPLLITLLRPDDAHTPELHAEHFVCTDSNLKVFRHSVAELALEGRWVYSVTPQEDLDSVSVRVESKSRDASTDPVMTRCWISTGSQEIDTTTNVKLAVVAEVSQGSQPVVGAKVLAMVERPPTPTGAPAPPMELELMDNGGGADKIKNDGTYSRCGYSYIM